MMQQVLVLQIELCERVRVNDFVVSFSPSEEMVIGYVSLAYHPLVHHVEKMIDFVSLSVLKSVMMREKF